MKILVIQQKMIGDVLTSSILFEALRGKYPDAELHYLIHRHTFPVVENNPFINKVLLFDPNVDGKTGGLIIFLKKIRKEEYDIVFDVYAKINSAIITAFSGAPKRISYYKKYTSGAYTHTFRRATKVRTKAGLAIENRMLLLQALDKHFPPHIRPRIYLTEAERSAAEELLEKSGILKDRALYMISILGSSEEKTYPLKYMAEVLDDLVQKKRPQLLFNYIPNQETQAKKLLELCSPITRKHVFFSIFGKSLREFMAITSLCDALIGNEGGAINMAKALSIPTFAIFAPWIKREAWAVFEDELNVVVHLKDHKPDVFLKYDKPKKNPHQLYKLFEPQLFNEKFKLFLSNLPQ